MGLRVDLEAFDRAQPAGRQGSAVVRARADLVDAAIIDLFDGADPPPGLALAASGGYGRRQQFPRSDIDLLILHRRSADRDAVAGFAERLLYPLWDEGLELGQAVRTPEECAGLAEQRLDALTAMLDLRWLGGDEELVGEARAAVTAPVRSDPKGFAVRLREAAAARRARFGAVGHRLEPELKEGEGGLRDVATLGWLAHAIGPLEEAGVLRDRERAAVEAAAEFLTRVRSALHLETGARTDRVRRDQQSPIAAALGFRDLPRLTAEDALMREVFEHGRQVAHIVRSAIARCLDEPEAGGGPLPLVPGDAAGVLDALADGASSSLAPSPTLLDAVEAVRVPDPVEWTDGVREAFLRLIRAGEPGVDALETLDRLGLLTRYLPAWADVRGRPQRDPYHRYAVDRHLTGALREMDRMLAGTLEPASGDEAVDPLERDAVGRVRDPDALRLGALLHDIGKVGVGGHVEVGARVADETLARMGVAGSTRELASFMVAQHLLLPDTATRRDLTAEDLILDVASRVGSPERLDALYLLAKADALATGSAAWTPWRRALLRELVLKVQRIFERGEMGEELAERLARRVQRLRDLLAAEPSETVERFVLTMPRGYFLTVEPDRAAAHFATIAPELGALEVRTAAVSGRRAGTYELLVVAADRPGLLSWIAGALALSGLSILTAQVFTTVDGTAVDLFEVEGTFEPDVAEPRWREIRATLRQAIEGGIALDGRVHAKRAQYPPSGDAPVTVSLDNDASDYSTVIEVGAPDRIGLLFDITSALADLQLDVHVAKVATYADRVIDAFYVRDAMGSKVSDPAQIAEIEAVVLARLEDPSAAMNEV